MPENPDDWRSAVDANTGRTYWYHRKTRISTWIQPDFLVEDDDIEDIINQDSEITYNYEDSVISQNNVDFIDSNGSYFKGLIELILNGRQADKREELKLLLEWTTTNFLYIAENAALVINEMVNIVAQSNNTETRQTALRCLFALSTDRNFSGKHFHSNQSWTIISKLMSRWSDAESIITSCAFHCNLLVGPTYHLIDEASKSDILKSLLNIHTYAEINIEILMATNAALIVNLIPTADIGLHKSEPSVITVPAVLDERFIQSYLLLAEKGHRIPAVWLITMFTHAFR